MQTRCFHKFLPAGPRADLEAELLDKAATLGVAPLLYDVLQHKDELVLCMERVDGQTLYELYGDDPRNIPNTVWGDIHSILERLFDMEGIEYIDITPFNFMMTKNKQGTDKIVILDFGHAVYTENNNGKPRNWFLQEFLDGVYTWNGDFA